MPRFLRLATCLVCLVVVSHAGAQAQTPPPEPPPPLQAVPAAAPAQAEPAPLLAAATGELAPPPPAAPWYGWQIFLADGAGILAGALVAGTQDSDASKLGLFAGTWYGVSLIAAPSVHYAHRHTAAGLADLPARALVPPLTSVFGLLATCLANSEFDRDCADQGMATGTIVGLAATSAFDALVLARMDRAVLPPSDWYGLQVLSIDALGLAIGAYYASRGPETKDNGPLHPAIAVWVMHYVISFIGAPIVHFAHGEVGRGFGSLGLRMLAGPTAGALFGLLGFCAATAGADDCAEDGALWGLVGGGLVAAAIDSLVLARESAPSLTKAQNFGVSIGAGTLGIHGRW